MDRIRIVLDVDGVMLNFMGSFYSHLEDVGIGKAKKGQTKQYDFWKIYGDADYFSLEEAFLSKGGGRELMPMPGTGRIKEILENPMYDPYFVTMFPNEYSHDRIENFKKAFGYDATGRIFFVERGGTKREVVESLSPRFFIEDNLYNLGDCEGIGGCDLIWVDLGDEFDDLSRRPKGEVHKVCDLDEAIGKMKSVGALTVEAKFEDLKNGMMAVLTDDLLKDEYAEIMRSSATEGHCYACAEAAFHVLGGKDVGLVPQVASFVENGRRVSHWWLRTASGEILDPTAEQFHAVGENPPYELGKGAGFLTRHPSRRAAEIIRRLVGLPWNDLRESKKRKMGA